jgi:hypothetical protein
MADILLAEEVRGCCVFLFDDRGCYCSEWNEDVRIELKTKAPIGE